MAALLVSSMQNAGFEVAAATSAAEARQLVQSFAPNVMLIDIFLGTGPNGIQLSNAIAATHPEIGLLLLTKFKDSLTSLHDMGEIPAKAGFLRKDLVADTNELIAAIEAVMDDRAEDVRHEVATMGGVGDLNAKQLTVLKLVAEGLTNAEIANRTELSVKSVERYLAQIFDVLRITADNGVNQRVEAARRYYLSVGIPQR